MKESIPFFLRMKIFSPPAKVYSHPPPVRVIQIRRAHRVFSPLPVTRHPFDYSKPIAWPYCIYLGSLTCREDWSECCNRWNASKADSLHHATLGDTETRALRRHKHQQCLFKE